MKGPGPAKRRAAKNPRHCQEEDGYKGGSRHWAKNYGSDKGNFPAVFRPHLHNQLNMADENNEKGSQDLGEGNEDTKENENENETVVSPSEIEDDELQQVYDDNHKQGKKLSLSFLLGHFKRHNWKESLDEFNKRKNDSSLSNNERKRIKREFSIRDHKRKWALWEQCQRLGLDVMGDVDFNNYDEKEEQQKPVKEEKKTAPANKRKEAPVEKKEEKKIKKKKRNEDEEFDGELEKFAKECNYSAIKINNKKSWLVANFKGYCERHGLSGGNKAEMIEAICAHLRKKK